jgi:hypothetical protein
MPFAPIARLLSSSRTNARLIPSSACLTAAQASGLAYEHKVLGALAEALASAGLSFDLAHNPWFEYHTSTGQGLCVPDILLTINSSEFKNLIFVIEIKLTYTIEAIAKLRGLYCPVVEAALARRALPLVICKNLTPEASYAHGIFFPALDLPEPLFQWLGTASIQLGWR